tara:strand:- start:1289 stop:1732 length:444 start_codon:yes stop_codon:yes gene_type:complete
MSVFIINREALAATAAAITTRAGFTKNQKMQTITEEAATEILRLCKIFNGMISDNLASYAERYREPAPTQADMWAHGLTLERVMAATGEAAISDHQAVKTLDALKYNTTEDTTRDLADLLMGAATGRTKTEIAYLRDDPQYEIANWG